MEEGERKERGKRRKKKILNRCVYIYIYIYIQRERDTECFPVGN